MKVSNEINIREINDQDVGIRRPPYAVMMVESHWNDPDLVVIQIGKDRYTVLVKNLRKAIDNATNWKW